MVAVIADKTEDELISESFDEMYSEILKTIEGARLHGRELDLSDVRQLVISAYYSGYNAGLAMGSSDLWKNAERNVQTPTRNT